MPNLSYRSHQQDKACLMYGLPESREQYDELENHRSNYDPVEN